MFEGLTILCSGRGKALLSVEQPCDLLSLALVLDSAVFLWLCDLGQNRSTHESNQSWHIYFLDACYSVPLKVDEFSHQTNLGSNPTWLCSLNCDINF